MDDLPGVVTTYLPLHVRPDGDRDEFLDEVLHNGLPAAAKHATFVDAFCESRAFTTKECEALFRRARDLGLKLKLHGRAAACRHRDHA